MSLNKFSIALAAVVLFQAGWIAGGLFPGSALADEPATAYSQPGLRMLCRTFVLDPDPSAELETADPSTPIGAWIALKSKDWTLYMVDFEIGQKSTGFPQPSAQVCLVPR